MEYACADGVTCVPESYRCDYYDDCGDNSDEIDGCVCDPSVEFECTAGGCIADSWVCDAESDCSDGSDEVGCVCEPDEFACPSGGCIADSWVCDGEADCDDGSDEAEDLCDQTTDVPPTGKKVLSIYIFFTCFQIMCYSN